MPPKRKAPAETPSLSRREREIMDALYACGEATVVQVREHLGDPPSVEATRSALWLLESRGLVTHRVDEARNVYRPVVPGSAARRSALRHLLTTFFGGSRVDAAVSLIDDEGDALTDDELARLARLVGEQRKRRSTTPKKSR
jgi:predicted transcriptional regulator